MRNGSTDQVPRAIRCPAIPAPYCSINPASALEQTMASAVSISQTRTVRCRFSSKSRSCFSTCMGYTSTRQVSPETRRRWNWKLPMECGRTWPTSPASSLASRAATSGGDNPAMGLPLGMIHRPLPRLVTRKTSMVPSALALTGRAATCRSMRDVQSARMIRRGLWVRFLSHTRHISGVETSAGMLSGKARI